MTPVHLAQAICVVVIWGLAFVATRLALDDFSPLMLTALRFIIAALPAALLPRPRIAGRDLVLVGLFLFTGQFLFQSSASRRACRPAWPRSSCRPRRCSRSCSPRWPLASGPPTGSGSAARWPSAASRSSPPPWAAI